MILLHSTCRTKADSQVLEPVFAETPTETGSYEMCVAGGTLQCSWELFSIVSSTKHPPLLLQVDEQEEVDAHEKAMRNRVLTSVTTGSDDSNKGSLLFPAQHSYTKILESGKLVGSYKFKPAKALIVSPQQQEEAKEKTSRAKHKVQAQWLHSNTQKSREKEWHALMRPVLRGSKVAEEPRPRKVLAEPLKLAETPRVPSQVVVDRRPSHSDLVPSEPVQYATSWPGLSKFEEI